MRSAKDPRHIARIIAVMELYHFHFNSEEIGQKLYPFEDLEIGAYSKQLKQTLVEGVKKHSIDIDSLINEYSDPIKVTDLDNLILQIVRIGVLEGFVLNSVPPKVAVDEAIELTRDFGTEGASRKVSGILGKIFDIKAKQPEQENNSN
jgi:N utilization substance protein B